jgi:hypothetical protein
MTPLWQLVAVVAEILRWLAGPPVSLADAAWREAARRQAVGRSVAAYTNATLPFVPEGVGVVPEVSAPASPQAPDPADEATWRRRVRELADAVAQHRLVLSETEARLAWLESQAASRDDPAQQASLRQQARQALESLTEIRRKVEAGEKAIATLQEEARRLRIPPGWLR